MNDIIIYKTSDKKTQIEVKIEGETVWLNQKQMADLFQNTVPNINIHIKNIYKEKELTKKATIKESLIVQKEGKREISRNVSLYNLDVIISVGYRVKSKRGTEFRQWATQRLNDYLVKGYAVNQKRLEQLQQTIQLISQSGNTKTLQLQEARGLLEIISNYTRSFILLNHFDSNNFTNENLDENITYEIQYKEAFLAITTLKKQLIKRKEASALFGNQKDDGFKGALQSIVQTFDGQYLYPTIEEQAANLLYFIIKNHPFSDGNKRIGAFLFVWFLEKNKHRFKKSGEVKVNDNGLAALALLVAQSNPSDKDLMIKLTINLIANI